MSEDRGPYKQLADLLVETVHKIGKGAEKKIDGGITVTHQKAPSKT